MTIAQFNSTLQCLLQPKDRGLLLLHIVNFLPFPSVEAVALATPNSYRSAGDWLLASSRRLTASSMQDFPGSNRPSRGTVVASSILLPTVLELVLTMESCIPPSLWSLPQCCPSALGLPQEPRHETCTPQIPM